MTRSRRLSSDERFDVFEFNEDDVRVEKASGKIMKKFGSPKKRKRETSPITKYKFLQFFAEGTQNQQKEIGNRLVDVPKEPIYIDDEPVDADNGPTDVDVAGSITTPQNETNDAIWGIVPSVGAMKDEIDGGDVLILSSSSNQVQNKRVIMIQDDDDSNEMDFKPTCAFSSTEFEEEHVLESGSGGNLIDFRNMTVAVSPGFIVYGGILFTEAQLTFARSCIKIDGTNVNGMKGTFKFEQSIDDIINIESVWLAIVKTAFIRFILKAKYCKEAGNGKEPSGKEWLTFTVYNPNWFEVQEAIKSLDVKYKNAWKEFSDAEWEKEEISILTGEPKDILLLSKNYHPKFDVPFEEVIYPKGDPDAVSISKRDIELLQPQTFINDTIIDFYIHYLKSNIEQKEQPRFHFFNSFFFRKLSGLDKDPSSACEGKEAFERVCKWTEKVNLFEKDYVFIPVNYSLHWSLIVICHPGEGANLKDDENGKSTKLPCILHMDSIRGSHRCLKSLVQSYLCEEWKARHKEMDDDGFSRFLHLPFVSPELPQQKNSFDCGLFLLHYVELFLQQALNFSSITEIVKYLNKEWFPPVEASLKRVRIQKLIHEILEDYASEVPSVDCTSEGQSQSATMNEQESEVEILLDVCDTPKTSPGDSSSSNAPGETAKLSFW
ncbi:probable ubiquitin-like-specific protease 2A isoform X2 [Tripterygium wilfordii]|uniref:probable ubiquitin-like-specific protease 2A isoform X2 n=1 Tax=Tripterygium wilfordii TaxID=458696 RepID=UPI0018F80F93|nr:probable ubiquitin-like-specific protease 2A isoform X2 [Tripterygium wilfordii]